MKPSIQASKTQPSMLNSPSRSISQRVQASPHGPTSPKPVITTVEAGSTMPLSSARAARCSADGGGAPRRAGYEAYGRGRTSRSCSACRAAATEPPLSTSPSTSRSPRTSLTSAERAFRSARARAVVPARSSMRSILPVRRAWTGRDWATRAMSGCIRPTRLKAISAAVKVWQPSSSMAGATMLLAIMRFVPRTQPMVAPTMERWSWSPSECHFSKKDSSPSLDSA
mmetsp:Transcript_75413/g.238381  ORF Transcript_75413/g.238381 Transcript_75413/m.238381 type:complete len:226 (-) Transcript_75413:334-1011(-)